MRAVKYIFYGGLVNLVWLISKRSEGAKEGWGLGLNTNFFIKLTSQILKSNSKCPINVFLSKQMKTSEFPKAQKKFITPDITTVTKF